MSIGAALLTIVIGVALSLTGSRLATAATIDGAIRNVTLTPTNPGPDDQLTTGVSWCVPDGTAAGDTFTLTLPEQLTSLPAGFPLKDANGNLVATSTISNTSPAVVTFTMTDYAQTHQNTCGVATFTSGYSSSATPPGQTTPYTYTTNDNQTFTFPITPSGGPEGHGGAVKKGRFNDSDQGHTNAGDVITWAILSPLGPKNAVSITDSVPAGQTIDCATVTLEIGDVAPGTGSFVNGQPYSSQTSLSCSTTTLSVSYPSVPADKIIRVYFSTSLDQPTGDGTQTVFNNTATVVTNDMDGTVTTENPVAQIKQSSGGGSGSGDKVTISKFSTADGPVDGAFDTAPGKLVPADTPVPVTMTIKNTGNNPLTDIAVTDQTTAGPALTGLTCDFSALGGPSSGTTWSGPLAVGATFDCTGTVPGMPLNTQETDVATVTGTGNAQVTASNPFNSHTPPPVPSVEIVKGDSDGNAADTVDDSVELADGTASLVYTITNNGEEALNNVEVTDTVVSNGTVTGLTCDFSTLGGPSSGTTWAGPFAVGDSFDCTADLTGVVPGEDHEDVGTVSGTGVVSGEDVDDDNPYHAHTPPVPSVTIVKGDSDGNAADTAADAVSLPKGSTKLVYTITNDGNEPLKNVEVTDTVVSNGTVTGLTCDFSTLGGPSSGTTWAGPLAVGAHFDCTAALRGVRPGVVHQDVATVTGTGTVSGQDVDDDNPYFAHGPSSPLPVLPNGSDGIPVGNVPSGIDTGRAGGGSGVDAMGVAAGAITLLAGLGLLGFVIAGGRRRADEIDGEQA